MKTILRIITILLVAAVVAGAFFLAVNNSSIASGSNEGGQSFATTSSNGQFINQPLARPEGSDRDSGSIARGLSEVLGTLAKLTGITVIVLLVQKASGLPGTRKLTLIKQ
ncbi:MAG TPA: hypothetical protein VF896_18395 [Anaerolineales bacterium]